MVAGITDRLWGFEDIIARIDADARLPSRAGLTRSGKADILSCWMTMPFMIAVALAAQGAPAAERWIEIGRDSRQTEFVDSQSVSSEGPWRLVWSRVDFSTPQVDGGWSALYRIEINCTERSYALVAFLSQDSDGRVINQRAFDNPVRKRIIPNTGSETILNIACSRGTD